MKEEFWEKLFLPLTEEEKKLVKLCPIVLKCSKEDVQIVGDLVWSYLANNDDFPYTFRTVGGLIADIFNKRFSCSRWDYMDFYMGNLRFWNPKTSKTTFDKETKKLEKKYGVKVYEEPEKER